jgi:hypothetical protein
MTVEELRASEQFYRSKDKASDVQLYITLTNKLEHFMTLDHLQQEVAHSMDSQVNESLNNTISWLAPKNKVYCGSGSLTNCIGIAVGINQLGMVEYFNRLFKSLGITMTTNVKHFLHVREKSWISRLKAPMKTQDKKKLRNKNKFKKLKEDTEIARKERARCKGTYKSGINMASIDGYTVEELMEWAQPAIKKSGKASVCKVCGLKGHAKARSKKCLHYKGGPACYWLFLL